MDNFDIVAVRIASRVAPDEVDLAPLIAHAMLDADERLRDLDRDSRGAVLGGFLEGSDISAFYALLQAISSCAAILSSLFAISAARWSIKMHQQQLKNDETDKEKELKRQAVADLAKRLCDAGFDRKLAEEKSEQAVYALLEDIKSSRLFLDKLSKKK